MMKITSVSDSDLREAVVAFLEMLEGEGDPGLSENKHMHLGGTHDVVERVAHTDDGSIAGYAQAAWHRAVNGGYGHWALELAVAPGFRETSLPSDLAAAVVEAVGDAAMTLWAHTSYVAGMANDWGWRRTRALLEMTCALPVSCDGAAAAGITFSTFRRGLDEEAWVVANNLAFAGHPENGALTIADLEARIRQPWFDPNGFFLAWDGDQLAGSCWTKVHGDGRGEIYIIGVVPRWERVGLGRALICRGLNYLSREKNATAALLYVEGDNDRATTVYEKVGFTVARRISAFSRPRDTTTGPSVR
ncbi:MAG: mycothiol synthase [Acidimicrobiia bacterium]